MMTIKEAAIKLHDYLEERFKDTMSVMEKHNGIYRGNLRSLSSDVEDGVAIFISDILPDCEMFIDANIGFAEEPGQEKKEHRPDILVIKDKKVLAMIELKTNMGWCRDATEVVDKFEKYDRMFKERKCLTCSFSRKRIDSKDVIYPDDVKLFIACSQSRNCDEEKHNKNMDYAKKHNIVYRILFDGEFGGKDENKLATREIEVFGKELLDLYKEKFEGK